MKVLIATLVFVLLLIASCVVGVGDIHWEGLLSKDVSDNDWQLLLHSRIPRSLAVLLTGSSMAITGLILQIIFNNHFVEPSLVGTTQGVGLGLLLMAILFPASPIIIKMIIAALCGLLVTGIFLFFIRNIIPINPLLTPLVGLIYSGIITSIAMFIGFHFDLLHMLDAWLTGEFSSVLTGRYEVLWVTIFCSITAYRYADKFTLAGLGKDIATNLGLNHHRVIQLGMLLSASIVASVMVSVGSIPFLGLVVPNIMRRYYGDNVRISLPAIAYTGGMLLLVCDILSRLIYFPYEISVSLTMGLVGTLLFLFLLYSKRAAT